MLQAGRLLVTSGFVRFSQGSELRQVLEGRAPDRLDRVVVEQTVNPKETQSSRGHMDAFQDGKTSMWETKRFNEAKMDWFGVPTWRSAMGSP